MMWCLFRLVVVFCNNKLERNATPRTGGSQGWSPYLPLEFEFVREAWLERKSIRLLFMFLFLMDEWFNFGTIRVFWWMNGVVVSGKETWITTGVHDFILKIELIQTSNRSNMDLDSHSTGWCVFCFLASLLGLETSTLPRWNAECLLDVQCSSQHFENAYVRLNSDALIATLSKIFLTASTPRDNFRLLRWILEKAQLYRWFLYVFCFIDRSQTPQLQ